MTYRKIIALLLIFALSITLCACKKDDEPDYVYKDGGSGEQSEIDGEGDSTDAEEDATKTVFVYSTSAKTLHRESCYHAAAIDELFKKTYDGDATALIEKGFSFCGLCCPEESKLYNETEEEKNGEVNSGVDPEDASYVINTGSGKFHELDCRYAESMNSQNRVYTSLSKDELVMNGYSPCKTCNP